MDGHSTPGKKILYRSLLRFIIIMTVLLFASNFLLGCILSFFPAAHKWILALLDSTLLVILFYPVLHIFGFRPILNYIKHRDKIEKYIAWLASFPELNMNPIIEVDMGGHIRYMNSAANSLFPDLKKAALKHTYLENFERVIAEIRQNGIKSFDRDIKINDKYYTQHINYIAATRTIRLYGSEITKRKRAEEALLESLDNLNHAQAVARIGNWRLDVNKNELTWSDENHRIFGISKRTHMTYETFLSAVHPDDRKYVDEKWAAALRGEPYDIEHRIIVKGKINWVREMGTLEFDKQGKLLGGFGTTQDITERKETERALRESEKALQEIQLKIARAEAVAAERKLSEKALLKAQEEINKAKRLSDIGTLAATVAHELRNPLAAMRMAAYNIKRKRTNLDLDRHLINIEKKIVESDQIISNLLFYSRIKDPQYEDVNICAIIDEHIETLGAQHKKRNISLTTKIDPLKDVFIKADPLQIREMVVNILNNAFDAVADEKGAIEIRGNIKNKDNIEFHIKDNGSGIEKENLEKVFEPFFTTKSKGTGLGLSVCYQIAHLHKGTINIESEKDQGTMVSVTLPIKGSRS